MRIWTCPPDGLDDNSPQRRPRRHFGEPAFEPNTTRDGPEARPMTDVRRQAGMDEFVGQNRGHEDRIVDEGRDRDVPKAGAIDLRIADAQGASVVTQRPHAQPDPQRNFEPMA